MPKNTKPFSDNNKQQLVLYGRHAVLAALKNPKRQILKILCTKENADEIRRTSKIQPQEVEKKEIDKLFSADVVHQGFALFCNRLPDFSLEEIIEMSQTKNKCHVLILDQVTDPQNIGTIIRSAVAKTLAGYGYSGILGLHHVGAGNPFNLADDLMEPLRPLVDLWVDDHCEDLYETLTRTNRRDLVNLVNHTIRIDGRKMRVRYAVDWYVKSLTTAINTQDAGMLRLPELIRNDPAFEDEQDG